jgi:hypothetical protein
MDGGLCPISHASRLDWDSGKKRRASNRIAGAASNQNTGDQPRVGSCSGKGVRPSSTMPPASQVVAARVNGSCPVAGAEWWGMVHSCSRDVSLRAGDLAD